MLLVNEKITQYLNHLLVERGASTNTLKAYERDLRRYERFLAEINCSEITPEGVIRLSRCSCAAKLSSISCERKWLARSNVRY
ncbi:MAG: Phage integrase, N-terminal SAM-like domain [Actinomycetota bacterium]